MHTLDPEKERAAEGREQERMKRIDTFVGIEHFAKHCIYFVRRIQSAHTTTTKTTTKKKSKRDEYLIERFRVLSTELNSCL